MNVSEVCVDIKYLDNGIEVICDYADMRQYSEARKRPFNAEEMKELVGKIAKTEDGDVTLITDYDWFIEKIYICGERLNSEELMNSTWRIDNNPCYKLEHLENGEWVE
jgi:hypothetical protein